MKTHIFVFSNVPPPLPESRSVYEVMWIKHGIDRKVMGDKIILRMRFPCWITKVTHTHTHTHTRNNGYANAFQCFICICTLPVLLLQISDHKPAFLTRSLSWPKLNVQIPLVPRSEHTAYLLTQSMVQSPSWAANWFAVTQEIPRISRNPKVHTALTSVRHLSLSWVSPIQFIYPHPTSWRSIQILSTHLA